MNLKELSDKRQKKRKETGLYTVKEDTSKPKFYILDMFPYPSGAGLHVGHPKGYIASDTLARKKMLEGFNVLHPMGFDTFGLGTENYAIEHKMKPQDVAKQNIDNYIKQLEMFGTTYDWQRSVNTADPKYFKRTQWVFLQLYNHYYDETLGKAMPITDPSTQERLAYVDYKPINRCPKCMTGLANEDLDDGKCERCGSAVEQKPMKQWVLRITKYAERLLSGLDGLQWEESMKDLERNWIGKSEGTEFTMKIDGGDYSFGVYTTRIDTVFGMSFVAIAPEHPLVDSITTKEHKKEVEQYKDAAKKKTQLERTELQKEKTGVFCGAYAINPFNGEKVPVYVADYVLAGYGTGVVMAVPAHDERDFEFAKKYNLPITQSIAQIYIGDGINKIRDNVETLDRKIIDAIIENDKGEFLIEIEENPTYYHFVGGGIEIGETEIDALKKEVIEETGYTDFEILGNIPGSYAGALAYRHTKSKNQKTLGQFFHIKLTSNNQIVSEIDEGKHRIERHKKEEIENIINWQHHKDMRNVFLHGPQCYTEKGILVASGQFSGMTSEEAIPSMQAWLAQQGLGGKKINYKLQDWVFSRQRYRGEPIPVLRDKDGNIIPLDEKELPLLLPDVENYQPTGTEEGPLANITDWVNVTKDGKQYTRETNTMPGWAGSSWYWLRYMDPNNTETLVGKDKEAYRGNVDVYVGGAEHITRHIIYGRFWQNFLYDIGVVTKKEPFQEYHYVGLIMGEDGRKMSKRWGNVVNPDDIVNEYGADALRVYEMFMGPFEQSIAWSTNGIKGVKKFLEKIEALINKLVDTEEEVATQILLHQSIKKLTEDVDSFRFNTSISQLMILVNHLTESPTITRKTFETLVILLAPFAPHLAEELWERLGNAYSIFTTTSWPTYDENCLVADTIKMAVQVNGKVRGEICISKDATQDDAMKAARADSKVAGYLTSEPKKIIYVAGRILNIVV